MTLALGMVMEGIIEPVAASIAANCQVPTIGIGARQPVMATLSPRIF